MWRNIRVRILAAFVLPGLILIPLIGFALVSYIERQAISPLLSNEITNEQVLSKLSAGLDTARLWIWMGTLAGVAVNILLALALSNRIQRFLSGITQVVKMASQSEQPANMPATGLAEIDNVSAAFNEFLRHHLNIEQGRRQALANVVHEIGRQLGSLQAAVHALLHGAESDISLRRDLLKGMAEQIESLGRLQDDLAFSHQPQQILALNIQPVRVSEWLNLFNSIWAEMARQKGIHWQGSWPVDLPVIEADVVRLEQALGNLVSNAIKFTPPGGHVSLIVAMKLSQLQITVVDDGPGIQTEDLPLLFHPFFRAGATAPNSPGLGLGLSIARTIVEAHGGSIKVRSQPGEGSQFTLSIPCSS